jgi:hypothetical protein
VQKEKELNVAVKLMEGGADISRIVYTCHVTPQTQPRNCEQDVGKKSQKKTGKIETLPV